MFFSALKSNLSNNSEGFHFLHDGFIFSIQGFKKVKPFETVSLLSAFFKNSRMNLIREFSI